MKYLYILFILIFLPGCREESGNNLSYYIDWSRPYTQIAVDCIDKVALGASLKVVINTSAEYDSLIYENYQKPLDDWRAQNYQGILRTVIRQNPGLSYDEYARLAEEMLYEFYPFKGTKGCTLPSINFSSLTLLGYGINSGGCVDPDYTIDVQTNNVTGEVTFHVAVVQHGSCLMAIERIIWVLVPKIPAQYKVTFASSTQVIE